MLLSVTGGNDGCVTFVDVMGATMDSTGVMRSHGLQETSRTPSSPLAELKGIDQAEGGRPVVSKVAAVASTHLQEV